MLNYGDSVILLEDVHGYDGLSTHGTYLGEIGNGLHEVKVYDYTYHSYMNYSFFNNEFKEIK